MLWEEPREPTQTRGEHPDSTHSQPDPGGNSDNIPNLNENKSHLSRNTLSINRSPSLGSFILKKRAKTGGWITQT